MATQHQTGKPMWLPAGSSPDRAAGALPVYCAVLLGYLMLLPPQFNLGIGGSVIPPYRFFLLASALYVVASFIRGRIRLVWPDVAILGATIWICFAMFQTSTQEEAFTASVAHITDVGLAYFFGRMAFRNLRDFRMFLIMLLPGLAIVGPILVLEAVTHTHIIQGTISNLTGASFVYGSSPRLGLMRAQGPFAHPILAGMFFSSFVALYFLAGFKFWPRMIGTVSALCSFVTVSSVTLLALAAVTGLLIYNWLTEKFVNITWSLFFAATAVVIFAAELGTGAGTFGLFIRYASLNAISGYNRILIWKYGTQNVAENPWFGLGYGDWERPIWMGSSMDNYWLILAVRFGIPAATFVLIATILAVVGLMRKSRLSNHADMRFERGIAIAVSVFALALMSASVWLSPQVWYFMLLGIAVSVGTLPRNVRPLFDPSDQVSAELDYGARQPPTR